MRTSAALLLALCLAAAPAGRLYAADEDGASEIELTSPGENEEMTIESEDKPPPPKPAPVPAPVPKPVPKPAPKPAPKPKPVPKPVIPKSPWEWLVIEDFDRAEPGKDVGALQRAAGVQFAMRLAAPGHDGPQALTLAGVPSFAEATVWMWTPATATPIDLSAWRGVSLWVKASQAVGELRLGVAGGGSIFTTVPLGTDWTEVRLDFARDAGRGRFNPARVTAIALAVAHELTSPVEVTVDTLAAWRERVPSDAMQLGLNVPPVAGPGDWAADFRAVNCAGRYSAAEGFVLGFWTGELPYAHRPVVATWSDLPRGLKGATALVAQVRLEPAQPAIVLKWTLVEAGGEQFSALRVLPSEGPVRIPLAEFLWDPIENLRTPPAVVGNGLLDLAEVSGWRLEILPATERPTKGMLVVKELWAEGRMKPGPRPPVKPLIKPVAPKAAPATTEPVEPADSSTTSAEAEPAEGTPAPKAKPKPDPAEGDEAIDEGGEEAPAEKTEAPATEGEAAPAAKAETPATEGEAAPADEGAKAETPAAPAAKEAPAAGAPEGGAEAPAAGADETAPELPGDSGQ
ncbi:MAG: hypothetical protein AAB152_11675 [Candidatus Coatesbacteria bacterium]